jgi:cysteine desulfurase / selenocysteine lyase
MLKEIEQPTKDLPVNMVAELNVRERFPIFKRQPSVTFLDSAATTQKPDVVLNAERLYFETACANCGRGAYRWAFETNELVQKARRSVSDFLRASSDAEIVFTSGSTMSLNLVALSWGEANLRDGDEIAFCPADHRSMNDPWRLLQGRLMKRGVVIKLVPYELKPSGEINIQQLRDVITHRTRMVNVTHVNNVAGIMNNLESIRRAIPESVLINLDIAQSVSHTPIDVSVIGADFVSFSGHKAFSTTGVGVLFVCKDLHPQLCMTFIGGGQRGVVNPQLGCMPELFECGTLNIGGIVSLQAALEFIETFGRTAMHSRLKTLTEGLYNELASLPQVEFLYPASSRDPSDRCGLVSFNVRGYSSAEVGDYLADNDIYVRYGDHCAGSAFDLKSDNDSIRASLSIYNIEQDIDRLCKVLATLPERIN